MVDEKKIVDKKLVVTSGTFNIDKLYKGIKQKSEELDYFFVEREHGSKPSKYGDEVKFDFLLHKELDYFGKVEVEIELLFENLKKTKTGDSGDFNLKIKSTQKLDYRNRWGRNKFYKFLFGLYLKIKKEDFKQKYTIQIIKETGEIYDYIKDEVEEYT